jgi:hypothetical protein
LTAAVTLPPVHVPVAAAPVATMFAGKLSVKLKVCVGLPVGWVMVKVKLVVAPGTIEAAKALFTVGTACVIVRLDDAVLPVSGPVAEMAPEVLL